MKKDCEKIYLDVTKSRHYQLWNDRIGVSTFRFGHEMDLVFLVAEYFSKTHYLDPELIMSESFKYKIQEEGAREYAVLKYLADIHKETQSLKQRFF